MTKPIDEFYDPLFYEAKVGIGGRPSEVYIDMALEGGPILELGCGIGDVLLPLARRGIQVCGVDSSSAMLTGFRKRLENEASEVVSRIDLLHCDMLGFKSDARFKWIPIPNDGIGHLLSDDALLSLCGLAFQHLRPGGQVLLDTSPFGIQYLAEIGASRNHVFCDHGYYDLPNGESVFVAGASSYDPQSGLLTARFRYEFIDPDAIVRRAHYRQLRLYPRRPTEIVFALTIAGFTSVQTQERTLTDGDRRVFITAVKAADRLN